MHDPPELDDDRLELDPQFLQCRREMFLVLGLFLVSLIWTISVSYVLGYQIPPGIEADRLPLVGGVPTWVFWGVLVPWLVIDLVAVWFCFFYMQDEPVADSEVPDREVPDRETQSSQVLHREIADNKIPVQGGVTPRHSTNLPNNGGTADL